MVIPIRKMTLGEIDNLLKAPCADFFALAKEARERLSKGGYHNEISLVDGYYMLSLFKRGRKSPIVSVPVSEIGAPDNIEGDEDAQIEYLLFHTMMHYLAGRQGRWLPTTLPAWECVWPRGKSDEQRND